MAAALVDDSYYAYVRYSFSNNQSRLIILKQKSVLLNLQISPLQVYKQVPPNFYLFQAVAIEHLPILKAKNAYLASSLMHETTHLRAYLGICHFQVAGSVKISQFLLTKNAFQIHHLDHESCWFILRPTGSCVILVGGVTCELGSNVLIPLTYF